MARLAYADPPYPGRASYYPEGKEVDHRELLETLATYDGWALSTSSSALRELLPIAPARTRVAAWVKPFASWKPGVNPAYTWEPVLFRPARKGRDRRTVRDWVAASAVLKKQLVGQKPPEFSVWLFELLCAEPGDEFEDFFPGSGVVSEAWERWRLAMDQPTPGRAAAVEGMGERSE